MGWQYQHAGWVARLKDAGIVQSMSRKGNCIDDDATKQVFGHLKDEFFRGREWASFEEFKRDLDEYVVYRRSSGTSPLRPRQFLFDPSKHWVAVHREAFLYQSLSFSKKDIFKIATHPHHDR